jgi:hypothetical protein
MQHPNHELCHTALKVAEPDQCKGCYSMLYTGLDSTGYGARFRQKFTLEDTIEIHAFAPLEALACVRPMPFLSGVRSSYRLAL